MKTAVQAGGDRREDDDGDAVSSVDARLLAIAYERLLPSLLMTLLVVVLFVVLLWDMFAPTQRVAWAVSLLAGVGLRLALWWAHRRRTGTLSLRLWQRLFLAAAVIGGLSWSAVPAWQLVGASGAEMSVLLATLLSVSAVAVSTLASQRAAMQGFIVAALAPAAAVAWSNGDSVERLASLVVMAGMASLVLAGRHSHAALRELLLTQDQLRSAVAAADRAREHAEAGSLAKSRFLANMSHELRTPLNAVIGAAQLLRVGEAQGGRDEHLIDAVRRGGRTLLDLIENILDLSRIEAGHLLLHPVDFHLVECIDTVLSTAAFSASAKGLALACVVDPELPAWRHGDEARLRQVLLNLLGNAMKFTATGEVLVRVRAGAGSEGVRFSVSDTGIGIEASALDQIFEPFRQADDGADRRYGGSGLGLSIVRQVVEAMGGSIGVTSTPGVGSCFEFELPLPRIARADDGGVALGHRVAVIEPHAASAEALAAQLLRLGCEVERPISPQALREWLSRPGATPWVLIAASAIEWLEPSLDIVEPGHVVALADDIAYEAEQARELNHIARQLVRPVTRAALVSRLSGPTAEPAAPAHAPALKSWSAIDAMTHVLLVEDDALNRSIVSGILAHAGHRVSVAENGERALLRMRELDRVDLVLMDWQMPDMDGLEVTRRMRAGEAGEAGRRVPVVALTANAFAEDRQRCLAAGMDDFLTKPVLVDRLLATLARWTGGRAEAEPGDMPVSPALVPAAPVPPPATVFDPGVLAQLPMVQDGSAPEVADELLWMFLEHGARMVAEAASAADAGDAATLLRLAHTLKSAAASVGAIELSLLAGELETALRRGQPAGAAAPATLRAAWQRLLDATRHAAPGPRPQPDGARA